MEKGYIYEGMLKININKNKGSSAYIIDSSYLWHNHLCDINFRRMHDMLKLDIPYFNENIEKCKTYMLTKITRNHFSKVERYTKLLELVYSDVCDLHNTPTIGGKKYFITFINEYSGYCYVYLLHSKNEVLEKFKIYKFEVELHSKAFIKKFRTNKRGIYYDPSYFESIGIIYETFVPYTLQQNSMIERKNRVLIEMVNAMRTLVSLSYLLKH